MTMPADPALALLRALVAIDSVNPTLVPGAAGEAGIAGAIAAEMGAIGLDVRTHVVAPGRPNVVGVLEGRSKGRTLMFCGHTDTVGVTGMAQPFVPVERVGRLYGRGAQDMKGGLAAMISAARGIVETGGLETGRLIVAAVIDEEHLSIGAEALVKDWAPGSVDGAIVTEPTDLAVVIAHKGFTWIDVEVLGKAAHGSRPAEGEDAILRMGRVLGRLESLDRDLQSRLPHPLLGTGSLHASRIEGGHELSSYPDACRLQVERRTVPGESESMVLSETQSILDGLALEDPAFRASARVTFSRPAYEISGDEELARTVASVLRRLASTARLEGASFWTDAAVLGRAGIPSVLFGPGGAGLHSPEEYVVMADVLRCRDVLVEVARAFC